MDEMIYKGAQLLIKNIPLNVDDKSLREVLEEHGQVLELEIKTYGWFDQKHASVYYATKIHAEHAFEKLDGSSLGGNKIKANWIETGVEYSNGNVDNLETLSHDQINSKGNPIVKDHFKGQDDSTANPEVQDNFKAQDDSKSNPKLQDDSKENSKVQSYSRENPKVQDNSRSNPKVHDDSKSTTKLQDDCKENSKVQNYYRENLKVHDESNANLKVHDESNANPKVQNESNANAKVHDESKSNPKVQDESNANPKVQDESNANPKVHDESNANPMSNHNLKFKGHRNVYVSGLSQSVSESILKAEFEKYAKVESITILKSSKWESDCNHAYVLLHSNASAEKVIHELNQTPVCGKLITVNWAIDKSDIGCVYISGLPLSVSEDDLRKQLEQYGRLLPHKIKLLKSAEKDEQHTYVTYVRQESAKKAVQLMNWSNIFGKPITLILKCHMKDSREIEKELFVENLPSTTDMVSIREVFQKYGEVTFVKIFRGYFERNVFVRFSSKDSAQKALAELNGRNVFGKNIRVSWSTDRKTVSLVQRQEMEPGKKMSLKFQAKADDVKASSGRGKGSSASTKSFKTNTVVGKLKRQVEDANFVPPKVGGEGSTPRKINSFGRGRAECKALRQSVGKSPPCVLGTEEDDIFFLNSMDFSVPPPNIQTLTPSSTGNNFLSNQSINHRFSSIVHKYSAMVLRPLSKEAMSGIKYVLEVSLKSELENLVTCIRKLTKLKASVDGEDKVNRSKKAAESLGMQLLRTLDAVDWTKLASFYNKIVTCPRAGTKMTEADILSKLRSEDESISEAERRVNELINHLRSIVLAFEDVEESNGVKPVFDMKLEECLEKAQECLDHPVENRDEEMIVWGKNKVEEILDDIDSAWNLVQEDSDVTKLLRTTENPVSLFEKKDPVKNKNLAKSKGANLNENKSLLSNTVQHFQSNNQSKVGFYDSNLCLREKKPQTRLGKKYLAFKSTETGYMQVHEIKTLVESHTKQHISPQMRAMLSKLDRDRDGWIFYDEFEAALTPDLLNIMAKK